MSGTGPRPGCLPLSMRKLWHPVSWEIKQKKLEVYSEGKEMTDDKRALILPCCPLDDMDEAEFEEYL